MPFPSPGDLPDPGIEPRSPALQADALTSEPPGEVPHDSKHLSKSMNLNVYEIFRKFLEVGRSQGRLQNVKKNLTNKAAFTIFLHLPFLSSI